MTTQKQSPERQPRPARYKKTVSHLLMSLTLTLFIVGCSGTVGAPQELKGKITVAGSTALEPLARAAATLFEKQHPQAKVEVRGGGSIFGLQAVTSGQADIGTSDVYADPAIYPDPNLTDHIVCVIPFAMVGGPGVTVNSLTQQEIIDIFSTGKIRNWQQVGGEDLPIVPVVRPATSGTRATFRKYILGGRDENTTLGTLLKKDSSVEIRDRVANTPGAIGYLALSVITPELRMLAINGQQPSQENIASGRYPFWSYEHMYTLGDTNNTLATEYLDFMLTPAVQQQAQQMGYIPIANMKLLATTEGGTGSSVSRTAIVQGREVRRNELFT